MKKSALVLLLAAMVTSYCVADTVHMRNGVQIHGKVKSQDEKRVTLMVGKREVILRAKEVARVVENDKTGVLDRKKMIAQAQKQQQELLETTGLNAQQRNKVLRAMALLMDPMKRAEGKRIVLAVAEEADVFRYFEWYLPSMLPRYIPSVLEIMVQLQPSRMKPILHEQCSNTDIDTRAKAIELIGRLQDQGAALLCARGLVDHEAAVRVAACHALGELRCREATAALLENLKAPDAGIQNAGRDALLRIWSGQPGVADFQSDEEWVALWQRQASSAPMAFKAHALKPLVEHGVQFEDE